MLPCYSLFLEVEIPDPDLNYFIVGQHELDNTEKLLAPPPFGVETFSTESVPSIWAVEDERERLTEVYSSAGEAGWDAVSVINGGKPPSWIDTATPIATIHDHEIYRFVWDNGTYQDEDGRFMFLIVNRGTDYPFYSIEINGVSGDERSNMINPNETRKIYLWATEETLDITFRVIRGGVEETHNIVLTDADKGVRTRAEYKGFQVADAVINNLDDFVVPDGFHQDFLTYWEWNSGNFCRIYAHDYNGSLLDEDGFMGFTLVYAGEGGGQRENRRWSFADKIPDEGTLVYSSPSINFGPITKGQIAEVKWKANNEEGRLAVEVDRNYGNYSFYLDLEYAGFPSGCEPSGLNTFVLNKSCLDGDIDLLEGWGAAKPDYKWVDVITDTTEINLQRGFDMKQGIVGTPIAGVMEANILDPYLEGLETSKVAVGQRVRLRAGTEIVFSGVASVVRSEYDAVNTPVLRIEAVDALGLLNAQMVDARPQENYNTRLAEAASKVELPIVQQDSTTELNPTEDPMSALELLVETQDSEGSVVWLDRYGTLYSTNRYWLDTIDNLPTFRNSNFEKPPRFTFTNNLGNPNDEIGIGATTQEVCLSQYKQVSDTSQVINGITFYNYVEEDDTDFEGLPIKTIVRDTYTFESANSRRLYGDAGVKLTTYLNPTDLVGYADYVFANYDTPKTKVETIQFPLDKWKSLDVPEMVSIDIGDPVKVRIDDPLTQHTLNRATQRVAQIRHRITPVEWVCELDLL